MKYSKPDISVLGNANVVIANQQLKQGEPLDGQSPIDAVGPAYDLDE